MVSIAGPCREGKSYILSKAFDQEEVFPLGHELDPETMGIWIWIVPEKYQVCMCRYVSSPRENADIRAKYRIRLAVSTAVCSVECIR